MSSSVQRIASDFNPRHRQVVLGRGPLIAAAGRSWLLLVMLGIAAGLCWRLTGTAPEIPQLLDAIGLALWLAAGMLKPDWDGLQLHQARHFHNVRAFLVRLASADYMLGAAVLLALAPCGVLLAFNPRALVAASILYEEIHLPLTVAGWLLLSLLTAAPSLVLASLVLLQALQALAGRTWGTVLWLLITPLAHAPLILGEHLWSLPLTLGQHARWVATTVVETQRYPIALTELLKDLLMTPVLIMLSLWLLLGLLQWPARLAGSRFSYGWLAALAGTTAVTMYATWQYWLWTMEPARQFPGGWLQLFALGMMGVWLAWWLMSNSNGRRVPVIQSGDIAWLLLAVVSWVLLGYPQIIADQVSQRELLLAAAATLPMAILGVLLIHRVARATRGEQSWIGHVARAVVLAGLLLPLPWEGTLLSPALILHRYTVTLLLDPTRAAMGGYLVAALLIAAALLWPWPPGRTRRKLQHGADGASPAAR